jgi:hypothetical protein
LEEISIIFGDPVGLTEVMNPGIEKHGEQQIEKAEKTQSDVKV